MLRSVVCAIKSTTNSPKSFIQLSFWGPLPISDQDPTWSAVSLESVTHWPSPLIFSSKTEDFCTSTPHWSPLLTVKVLVRCSRSQPWCQSQIMSTNFLQSQPEKSQKRIKLKSLTTKRTFLENQHFWPCLDNWLLRTTVAHWIMCTPLDQLSELKIQIHPDICLSFGWLSQKLLSAT